MTIGDFFEQVFFCRDDCKAPDADIGLAGGCGFDAIVLVNTADDMQMPGLPLSARLPEPQPVIHGPRRYGDGQADSLNLEAFDDFVPVDRCDSGQHSTRHGASVEDKLIHDARLPTPDAVIGRGFSATLKRGVAMATDGTAPERAEVVHEHKDGGFITTIQEGLKGMLGVRPSSKEELLRMRGLTKANEYEAVPSDEVDQEVQQVARKLPDDMADCLKIFRVAKGEYELELAVGRAPEKVYLFRGQGGALWARVLGETPDDAAGFVRSSPPEPLNEYLHHCANVAYSLQNGQAVTQVPSHLRMSFDVQGASIVDGTERDRYLAMGLATKQASMREKAAMEWRNQNPREDTTGSLTSPRG